MDEKHKEWIILGGAAASVIGLWYLYKSRPASAAIPVRAAGGGGGTSTQPQGLTDAQKLNALTSLAGLQMAQERLNLDKQIAADNYALGAAKLQTAESINAKNQDSDLAKKGISALGDVAKALFPEFGKGGRDTGKGDNRIPNDFPNVAPTKWTDPAYGFFPGPGKGLYLGRDTNGDLGGQGVLANQSDAISDPSLSSSYPPWTMTGGESNNQPYWYDDSANPATRFDDLSAYTYKEAVVSEAPPEVYEDNSLVSWWDSSGDGGEE